MIGQRARRCPNAGLLKQAKLWLVISEGILRNKIIQGVLGNPGGIREYSHLAIFDESPAFFDSLAKTGIAMKFMGNQVCTPTRKDNQRLVGCVSRFINQLPDDC